MPCISVRHVNSSDETSEARLNAAKLDWERGLFKSKRAAARAYDVSQVYPIIEFGCLYFRFLTQHYVIRSMGDVARERPTNPNSCSPIPRRQFCAIGLNSVHWLQSHWTCRVFSVSHLSCLAGHQAKIGLNGSRSAGPNFPIQGLEVLIQSGHKTSTPQTLEVFMNSSR